MSKRIIKNKNKETRAIEGTEFVLMTNDRDKITKRILTLLLKQFTLLIELHDNRLIAATYKDFKMIGRTPSNILLVYNELTEEEREINIEDIKIVRVFK
ncbi:hypothetical protein EDC18_103388 [Natranaerovirga pectinivora]|uniref:Uncharacterized protein n=1 Tax=Natranaerovirga pectinivora TaxID=682400 RepID=A0A4R3MS97_9FIRM|nr:hypothetical protein [Natranaerovirga pectinivora]TCT15677.1 hypothetical protein EDC18_103388 [Natranaerovirga pectinivora]